MFAGLKNTAETAARKAGLFTGGLLCISVGAGFLTVAAWVTLELAHGALTAAFVLGVVYLGLGLVLIGVSANRAYTQSSQTAIEDATTPQEAPPLVQAFLQGLQAGAQTGQRPN
jgi:hypothetical protein